MRDRQLYINNVLCDLPDATPVAITFQINNLADLQDRQSTYTNAIKLPKTATNSRALGYANIDAFTQNEPYQNNPCKYVENGVEVIPYGVAIIQSVTDFFDVQLIYGVAGLNDLLDDVNIQDLDFTDTFYPSELNYIADSQSNTSGYLWPIIDVGNLTNASIVNTDYLRPAFFTKTIIEKIAERAGYRFFGAITNDRYYKAELITSLYNTQPTTPSGADLPDISVKDFMKDVMQRYFLTPEVDNYNQTLRFRSFDELYVNVPNAKNWTSKFVNNARSDTFALPGYAQSNRLEYKELASLRIKDSGSIVSINNKTLDNVKTIVTSKFSATDNIEPRLGGLTLAYDELLEGDTVDGKTKTTNARVLYDRKIFNGGFYELKQGLFSELVEEISVPYFYMNGMGGLRWAELLQRYGTGLTRMLEKSRVVTRYAVLDAYDVYNFDYFTPVFDETDAVYYYVNQIINWQPGVKTKVNLIRL